MGIVLSVLGILGKIILWILGILCILVLLLLFYPIKYQGEAKYHHGLKAQGGLHWFWFLLRVGISYEEEFRWHIRVFGLDIMKLLEKHNRKEGSGKEKSRKENFRKENSGQGFPEREDSIQESARKEDYRQEKPTQERNCQETSGKENTRRGDFAKSSVILGWRHKLCGFVASVKRFFHHLRHKTGFLRELVSFLREDNTKAFVCILKDNVVHLWRKLKPKVLRGRLLFGTGDPASTGEILGIFAILYAWYGDGIRITPDFEQKIWEGEVFLKGRISLITIVTVLARMFLCDEWGRLKKQYDKVTAGIQ